MAHLQEEHILRRPRENIGLKQSQNILVLFDFDVTSMMEYLGLDGNVGDVLGTWAGAVVLSSSFYPISIYGTSHLAPYVGKKRAERKR